MKGNAAGVETFVLNRDYLLAVLFADDNTRVTPGEVVLVPEGVDGEDKGIDGEGDEVDYHPSNVLPLSFKNEDQGLKSVHCSYHDDRYQWELAFVSRG